MCRPRPQHEHSGPAPCHRLVEQTSKAALRSEARRLPANIRSFMKTSFGAWGVHKRCPGTKQDTAFTTSCYQGRHCPSDCERLCLHASPPRTRTQSTQSHLGFSRLEQSQDQVHIRQPVSARSMGVGVRMGLAMPGTSSISPSVSVVVGLDLPTHAKPKDIQ
jgi:hypothetical protein